MISGIMYCLLGGLFVGAAIARQDLFLGLIGASTWAFGNYLLGQVGSKK